MKIWPIVTLGSLIYGSTLSDGMNTRRESVPHPRPHWRLDNLDNADMPHRVATMAYREFFAKLLQDGVETTDPEHSKSVATDTNEDADDGEDPGKKLFWKTVYPGLGDPAPFPGWGYADPDLSPVAPIACSSCRPTLTILNAPDDPAPPHLDENVATTTNSNIMQLPFGALKTLNNVVVSIGQNGTDQITLVPCETILVNGMCPMPCKDKDDPLCKDDPIQTPPILSNPGNPIVAGGGSGSGTLGGFGSGGGTSIGGIPEPSTWALLIVGFSILAWIGYRRNIVA